VQSSSEKNIAAVSTMAARVKGNKDGLDGSSLNGVNDDAPTRLAAAKAKARATMEARAKAKAQDTEAKEPPAKQLEKDASHGMMAEQDCQPQLYCSYILFSIFHFILI
jgi:hypothetical protein